jgi:hypothetical protein
MKIAIILAGMMALLIAGILSPIFVAIATGLSAGAVFGFRSSKALALWLSRESVAPRFVQGCAWSGVLLLLLPTFFVSFAAGGTLGGGWGEAASTAVGLGGIGTPFGMAAGMALVMVTGLSLGSLIGGSLGKAAARFVRTKKG